jgi:5'-3' exonuclease
MTSYRPTLILDAPSLIYRAFFALPPTITNPKGQPVNALQGYCQMLAYLLSNRHPREVINTFDADWRPAFRVAAYADYKSNREDEPADLTPQIAMIEEVLAAAGLPVASASGFEADDVIGTYAVRATDEEPIEIVSGDRDLLQLVRDPAVAVLFTVRGVTELHRFDEETVLHTYGVTASRYADFAILRGDPSDGLPGVKGVGDKAAVRLVTEYPSIDAMIAAGDAHQARLASSLANSVAYLEAMKTVVPVCTTCSIETSPAHGPDVDRLRTLGREHGMQGVINRLIAALSQAAAL